MSIASEQKVARLEIRVAELERAVADLTLKWAHPLVTVESPAIGPADPRQQKAKRIA